MEQVEAGLVRYRVAFAMIATLVLFILVVLPFSVASVVEDILGWAEGRVFPLSVAPHSSAAATHTSLHIAVVAVDEVQQLATLRVSGNHICRTACTWSDQVLFFAVAEDPPDPEGLPPSASLTLPPTAVAVTQTLQLPLRGQPIHYPFDTYELWLGVVLQRVFPDGSEQPLTRAEAAGHLFLTVQEQLPRQSMSPPVFVDPQSVGGQSGPYEYLHVAELTFARPLYLRVLAVLLVLLVTAAAAYAVFLRPLHELVVNSGALVLGVWGIRSILTPGNLYYVTAVDLSLSVVILFLLGAITVRALLFFHERSGLRLPGRKPPQ